MLATIVCAPTTGCVSTRLIGLRERLIQFLLFQIEARQHVMSLEVGGVGLDRLVQRVLGPWRVANALVNAGRHTQEHSVGWVFRHCCFDSRFRHRWLPLFHIQRHHPGERFWTESSMMSQNPFRRRLARLCPRPSGTPVDRRAPAPLSRARMTGDTREPRLRRALGGGLGWRRRCPKHRRHLRVQAVGA